jgi:bacterioferritin-associated ferredoxin
MPVIAAAVAAAASVLEMSEQLGVAALCGRISAQLCAFIVGVNLAVLVSTGCVQVPFVAAACSGADALHSAAMAAFFVCHGIVSYVTATKASELMPQLELVGSPCSMV